MSETTTIFYPVGQREFDFIQANDFITLPPKLSFQPFFFLLLHETHALHIARDWNTLDSLSDYAGYVVKFLVKNEFLSQFIKQNFGGSLYQQYWVPSEAVADLNDSIVDKIEVVAEFHPVRTCRR